MRRLQNTIVKGLQYDWIKCKKLMVKSYIWLLAALSLAWFAPSAAAQVSSGTAFSIASDLLITNHHVVAGCRSVDVITANSQRPGSIVDVDNRSDLALLRVSGIKGETARLRSPRSVRLGEPVMVFGFPLTGSLSSSGNFTSGLISALRGWNDASGRLQITAPVQPGNSGGPLMDASGLVIGVVQSKLDALRLAVVIGDIPQNVNFAISLDVLANFLARNNVTFRESAPAAPLDTAQVAQMAQRFTYQIECRRSQQAGSPQRVNQGRAQPSVKQDRVQPSESEVARARNDIIQKMRESREGAEKLLVLHEAERQRAADEYERRRELYYQRLIALNEVLQAEQLLAKATTRVEEDKRWLAEADAALSEFMRQDELLRSGKTAP